MMKKSRLSRPLGFANGTNTFADLTNVTLIREKDNKINYYYLDLTQKNIVASEFYYLLPNDVIIINPINAKYRSLRDYSLSIIASVMGTVAYTLSSIVFFSNCTNNPIPSIYTK